MWNRGPLKILNGIKLILDDQGNHLDLYTISLESFRSFRGPLFRKPVTGREHFFAVSYSKPGLNIHLEAYVIGSGRSASFLFSGKVSKFHFAVYCICNLAQLLMTFEISQGNSLWKKRLFRFQRPRHINIPTDQSIKDMS